MTQPTTLLRNGTINPTLNPSRRSVSTRPEASGRDFVDLERERSRFCAGRTLHILRS